MSALQVCELKIVLDEPDTLHKHSRCSIELETTALGFLMLVEQHVRDYFELSGSLFRQELVILLRGFDVVAERNQRKGVRLAVVAFELNLLFISASPVDNGFDLLNHLDALGARLVEVDHVLAGQLDALGVEVRQV